LIKDTSIANKTSFPGTRQTQWAPLGNQKLPVNDQLTPMGQFAPLLFFQGRFTRFPIGNQDRPVGKARRNTKCFVDTFAASKSKT
jgi:hypothetical protein